MNNSLQKLNRRDFQKTFENEGTSFLFEDLVINYYMIPVGESLNFSQTSKRVYLPKLVLERMRKEGVLRTPEKTRQQITLLDSNIVEAIQHISVLYQKNTLTRSNAEEVFRLLGQSFTAYLYFDPWYWDGVFDISQKDSIAAENVRLVQDYKNVARSKLELLCFTPDSLLRETLSLLSNTFTMSVQDLEWYREAEVIALFDGNRVLESEIAARKSAYLYYLYPFSNILFISGEEAKDFIEEFETEPLRTVELQGRTAHSIGSVIKGRVRIIRRNYGDKAATQRQMDEMVKGEILVSESTDPELIPAFQKAAAIITDIGGLLSHAAITSREMNLPCVVGVSEASKILKTGDLVEVDAEKGIVRILEKAKNRNGPTFLSDFVGI